MMESLYDVHKENRMFLIRLFIGEKIKAENEAEEAKRHMSLAELEQIKAENEKRRAEEKAYNEGKVDYDGIKVDSPCGVRPAMWIELNS